jgi:glucose-1-phosphate thymidylyltransferase
MAARENLRKEDIIGLIPAGGSATRLDPLPCSKELYPIGFRLVDGGRETRPKVASHYLLEKMQLAGITKAYIVLRQGKWDIPRYLGDGSMLNMHLGYLIVNLPFGAPFTLDQAYPFVRDAVVAFGFPDILFQPDNVFIQLLAYLEGNHADVVLGLFPADQPDKMDMVEVDHAGRVIRMVVKPRHTELKYSWAIALWTPVFSQFLHDHLSACKGLAADQPELSVGNVIQAAIQNGLRIEAVVVSNEPYLDIGTAEGLVRAVKYFAG